MSVTGCKRGDLDVIPPGHTATAICDTGYCTRANPPNCQCPTGPNECANDNEGDNVTNYSNTESILSSDILYQPVQTRKKPKPKSRSKSKKASTGL